MLVLPIQKNTQTGVKRFNAFASLFATDWELHQGEHEDGDGPAAAERRPQPHRRHVGNGHQPALSNSRADPEAHRRGNPGDAGSTLTLSNTYYMTIFVNYYLKYWILDQLGCSSVRCWVNCVPWSLNMFSKTGLGAIFGVFASGYSDFDLIFCNTATTTGSNIVIWFLQVLNQTSRLEIQLLENSLSTNKLEKELMIQTNEISKLHDKNR